MRLSAADLRPPTVVRIIDRLNVGGPAIHAVLSSALLDRGRFRTLLVYGDIEPGEGDMAYLLSHYEGVAALHLPGLSRELRPLQDLRALLGLTRLLLAVRPAVVHTHKTKAGLLGRIAAVACGVPVRVHTYHGHVLEGYFGQGRARALLWLERLLAIGTSRVVTISPALRAELGDRLRVAPAARISVVPLGLDLGPFRRADALRGRLRAELGLSPTAKLVGMVGRMVPIKDHATLLAALAALCKERTDVHCVLVGGGETEAAITRQIGALGLKGRVHLLGWRRDLPAIYADLDVLALTSRNEGTPVAVIEALCAGVPVVATAVGGVPDVLLGGRRGALVRPGDPAALAAALRRALDDPQALARAQDPAQRDQVCAEFGAERLCSDLADLYEQELHQRGLRSPVLVRNSGADPVAWALSAPLAASMVPAIDLSSTRGS